MYFSIYFLRSFVYSRFLREQKFDLSVEEIVMFCHLIVHILLIVNISEKIIL